MDSSVWDRFTFHWKLARTVSGCQSSRKARTLTRVQGYCGDSIVADPARGADSVCDVPCRDDSSESCGGLKLLKRAQKALAAYSTTVISLSTATTPRPSTAAASSASVTGGTTASPSPSFSRYPTTTSSTPVSSLPVTASSTGPLPYGCTDLACVTLSESNAGRNGGVAATSSLPFGCNGEFPSSDLSSGVG